MKTTMAEPHRGQEEEQHLSSLQSTHEGATIVNIGEVIQNHDEGHHCNWLSSPTTTTTSCSAPCVHRQNQIHPALSPVNETVVNLAGHNNTFNFVSLTEPRAADAENSRSHRRYKCRNCAKFFRKRWAISSLITLVIVIVAVGGFIYSVKPNKLKFSIEHISIQGFSNTSTSALSPSSVSNYSTTCNITMKVRNPNKLFGIYHDDGSVISVHHRNTELFHGAAPSLFYQKAKNETTLKISLKNDSSSSIGLLKKMQDEKELSDGMIPLDVRFGARVTFKFSSVSIKVTIWADCRLIVNALAEDSKIFSQHCPVTLDFALFALHVKL